MKYCFEAAVGMVCDRAPDYVHALETIMADFMSEIAVKNKSDIT